jgi:hypothetical protein
LFIETFDSLPLGPNVEEASAGDQVWTKTPPANWTVDDTGMPGYDQPDYADNDGRKEWAGWSFADVKWWPTVVAAFGTYGCMYAFRKPFTAATFTSSPFADGFKTWLVTVNAPGEIVTIGVLPSGDGCVTHCQRLQVPHRGGLTPTGGLGVETRRVVWTL